jgi:hypothetical protein
MLELFKRILKENSTVRETEELARQVKGEVQQKEPRTKVNKLWVPEFYNSKRRECRSNR